ncbi:hypothetical protein DIPPA_14530 [Diplonema papillatum]|nr:hypothetical protein DIPPA_14530 [Diplonema papillatum]
MSIGRKPRVLVQHRPLSTPRSRGLVSTKQGWPRLIDVAITFPLQANAVKKAAETEGGAATKYEAVKRRTYDGPILAEAPEQQDLLLVPLVVDTFGAWGESAPRLGH